MAAKVAKSRRNVTNKKCPGATRAKNLTQIIKPMTMGINGKFETMGAKVVKCRISNRVFLLVVLHSNFTKES